MKKILSILLSLLMVATLCVVNVSADTPVAQIGEKKYETLQAAVNNVETGETIVLLGNVSDGDGVKVSAGDKTFEIDLAGYTYTFGKNPVGSNGTENQGLHLLPGNTITIKNGTLNVKPGLNIFRFIIQNYCNLTLDKVYLDGTNLSYPSPKNVTYTLSNNNGEVKIKNGTTIIAANGCVAFDADFATGYPTYPSLSVKVEDSTIIGDIEVTNGNKVGSLTIANGAKNNSLFTDIVDAVKYADSGTVIGLYDDVVVDGASIVSKDVTVELNGKSIQASKAWTEKAYDGTNDSIFIVKRGGTLTIKDSSESKTGKVFVEKVGSVYSAVKLTNKGEDATGAKAKFVLDSGIINGLYYGIVGNGGRDNTEIIINGGTVMGNCGNDNVGIYHPQDGELTINGGKIQGYSSAIEMRAGKLTINNPQDGGMLNLISTAKEYKCAPNGSGNTTEGAALAIAQHNTKKAINVTINGGRFDGLRALNEADPQENNPDNVIITINDGIFMGDIRVEDADKLTVNKGVFADPTVFNYIHNNYEGENPRQNTNDINVQLQKDITLEKGINVKGAGYINLNGYKIVAKQTDYSEDYLIDVNHGGCLRIEDNSTNKTGSIGSADGIGNVMVGVKLTSNGDGDVNKAAILDVYGGNIYGTDYGISGNGNVGRENTEVSIYGGNIKALGDEGIGIYQPQKGELSIYGGTVEGNVGVYVKCGTAVSLATSTTAINGGEIIGNGDIGDYAHNGNGGSLTGDAFVVENCDYPGGAPSVTVRSGKFYSENGNPIASYSQDKTKYPVISGFVSGGLFNVPYVDKELFAEGYGIKEYDDQTYKYTVDFQHPESYEEIVVDENTSIETLVTGDAPVKDVEPETLAAAVNVDDIVDDIKADNPKAENIEVKVVLEANTITKGLETENVDDILDTDKGQIVSSYLTIEIKQTVKVDGDTVIDRENVKTTDEYQYIPVEIPEELQDKLNKIIIVRDHEGEAAFLQKAASKYDAERFGGDCYYIDADENLIIIKSKNFSVYAIGSQTDDVPVYKYTVPTRHYNVPNTGINR